MRAPAFWFDPPPAHGLGNLLAPLGRIYAFATARRLATVVPRKVGVPVICLGNLSAGGTGKTPAVIAMLGRLSRRGIAAHVVTRGYGGRLAGPVAVDPRRHTAADVGDEPLLLSAFAPVWVARDRLSGAQAAVAAGAAAVILDDGFQNPALVKDISVVVADAEVGFGNGLCLPAGPLREPVATGLARADLLLTVGDADAQARFATTWAHRPELPATLAQVTGRLQPLETGMDWQGTSVFAFAGIGRPEKFFATLRALGADVVRAEALDDHATLSAPLMRRFAAEAAQSGAQLVTTEKDAARLPPAAREGVTVLPVRLVIDDWGPIDRLLDRVFGQARV